MEQLDACNQQEAARIVKLVARTKGKPGQKDLEKMANWLERGLEKVRKRQALHKPASFPAGLPVSDRVDDIREAIENHQVVIIAGETGSGKTTQIPKICMNSGRGIRGLIGHTQPRRIAARSVAARIADELGEQVGQQIGYQVRFSDNTSEQSRVKVMTDGILLAEVQNDRFLDRYDTLIIDEAHERSLNIDFLLGYLKQLLPKRPDLKVIITSATIELDRFSEFFDKA
ncbi:MAG: DEAD/DEAH box helicase, partial [Marinobacter sp.]